MKKKIKWDLIKIILNKKVNHAIFWVNSAIANQLDWNEINEIIQDAKDENHQVALAIKELKLEINHIILSLT